MTTIVTDGNFLITDKRTSGKYQYKKSKHRVYTDETTKIVLPEGLVTYLDHRIVAVTGAGLADEIARFTRIIGKSNNCKLEDVFNIISNFSIGGEKRLPKIQPEDGICTLILLCEDGGYLRAKVINHVKRGTIYTHVDVTRYENGELYIGGSGATLFCGLAPYIKSVLTVKEIFLFCTHTDPHSSHDYSVYSWEEDKLFTTIQPTEEDIRASAYRVQYSLDLYNPEMKTKALGK